MRMMTMDLAKREDVQDINTDIEETHKRVSEVGTSIHFAHKKIEDADNRTSTLEKSVAEMEESAQELPPASGCALSSHTRSSTHGGGRCHPDESPGGLRVGPPSFQCQSRWWQNFSSA